MGMQCHFNALERPDFVTLGVIHDVESDTYSAELQDDDNNVMEVCYSPESESCWFDIGQHRPDQMVQLELLIQWRICFSCS